jgi:hypothetical protein
VSLRRARPSCRAVLQITCKNNPLHVQISKYEMSEWEEKASRFATLICMFKCRPKETKRNNKNFTRPCPKRRHAPEATWYPIYFFNHCWQHYPDASTRRRYTTLKLRAVKLAIAISFSLTNLELCCEAEKGERRTKSCCGS